MNDTHTGIYFPVTVNLQHLYWLVSFLFFFFFLNLSKPMQPLEKGMTTHFSILTWKIPWADEPAWLQSMGSKKVGYD